MINELALTLLSIYTSELPIRRLRVTTELMHFKLCQPSASLEVDKQVVQECERYVFSVSPNAFVLLFFKQLNAYPGANY